LFRGVTELSLDSKGRMAMPKRYRERLVERSDGRLVVTIDTDERCLLLYPLPEWETIERKLDALPSFNAHARRVQRLLMGHATDAEMDGTGRILVPPPLRQYAGMDKRVVLIGQGKKFELWDEAQWAEKRDQWLAEETVGDVALPTELQSLSL
jgi:MraZ protein